MLTAPSVCGAGKNGGSTPGPRDEATSASRSEMAVAQAKERQWRRRGANGFRTMTSVSEGMENTELWESAGGMVRSL